MEYNSTRNKLFIPEYGRNVQKMVEYALTVEDRNKRTQLAHVIVSVMTQIHPQQKEIIDLKQKLWDHLHIISDYKLVVDAPFPAPQRPEEESKPSMPTRKANKIRFRYYGRNTELIIQKAMEYEDGPERDELIRIIANHLKKAYVNWNRDSVTDELIAEHLALLSKDKLKLNENTRLEQTAEILARNKKRQKQKPRPAGGFRKKR